MEGVQIRLPQQIREVAKKIALEKSTKGQKVTETDIYRTAILIFLSNISTDSREIQE